MHYELILLNCVNVASSCQLLAAGAMLTGIAAASTAVPAQHRWVPSGDACDGCCHRQSWPRLKPVTIHMTSQIRSIRASEAIWQGYSMLLQPGIQIGSNSPQPEDNLHLLFGGTWFISDFVVHIPWFA